MSFKSRLKEAYETLVDAQLGYDTLLAKCPHEFRELTEEEKNDEWMSVGAYCIICRKGYGWRCKENPKGYCEYKNGDYDQCDHCGHPEERK